MGESVRSRHRQSAVSKSTQVPMHRTMNASWSGRGCRASFVLLGLLATFAVVLLANFVFTLRIGHSKLASLADLFRKTDGELRPATVGVYDYEIVREFHHDHRAFTQGLVYGGNGTLFESTGLYGQSTVREVDLLTGKVRRNHQMKSEHFGEGLTIWKNKLLQVVWKVKTVFVYDRERLVPEAELSHKMQDGWGLTTSNDQIIGSDGTSKLYFMNPDTFEEVRVVTVKDEDKEVGWLNELEFVKNEIWANIWHGGCIARISPEDGKVTGWILLHGLRNGLLAAGFQRLDVLNGIAWDSEDDKVYVTGKMWPKLFEIKLVQRTQNANGSLQAVQKLCNIGKEGFQ